MASRRKNYNFPKRNGKALRFGGQGEILSCRNIENTKLKQKLSPFEGESHFNKFKTLINSIPLSSVGSVKPLHIILKMSDVICKIIFATPVRQGEEEVVKCFDYCIAVLNWKTTNESNETVNFDQVLVTLFIISLCKRFTYKEHLKYLLKNRQISLEKQDKWLNYQYEQQGSLLKGTDSRSIYFLKALICTKPRFVYHVLEALLRLTDTEALLYDYINDLLKGINFKSSFVRLAVCKNEKDHFQSIRQLAQENESVPLSTRNLLTEHWNKCFEGMNRPGGQDH